MTREEFSDQIGFVFGAILDYLKEHPPTGQLQLAKDWPTFQATLRRVAADLILCADVKEGIDRLQLDQGTLASIVWLTTDVISSEQRELAIQHAYEATSHEPSVLPFHAFCSFLIELSNHLKRGQPSS